jgi:acetyl esterase/lipase
MRFLVAFLGFLAAACSPLTLLNAAVPSSGFSLQEGISYGPLARQKLDVYRPDPAAFAGPRPVLFFLYGGAWQGGERGQYTFVGQAFASRGFVVVIPDYRVYPEVRYPAFVRDAAAAFAWTHEEIGALGGDPAHIVVAGHSAGAHIGALLAFDERFLREVGLPRSAVHGFIGLAGPYDFEPDEPDIEAALTGEGPAALAMPTRYVHGGEPPALLLIGDEDRRVARYNQERMAAALRAHGDTVEARVLPGYGHPGILARVAAPIRDVKLVDAIAGFAAR